MDVWSDFENITLNNSEIIEYFFEQKFLKMIETPYFSNYQLQYNQQETINVWSDFEDTIVNMSQVIDYHSQ